MNATADTATRAIATAPPPEVAAYVQARVITADDVATTGVLISIAGRDEPLAPQPLAWVALGLALRTPRDGHTCVDLSLMADWAGAIDPDAPAALPWPADAAAWKKALDSARPLVGRPGDRRPFILDGNRLYLARSLREEQEIARRLSGSDTRGGATSADGHAAGRIPARVRILLGGPGTGKTTEVARRLIEKFTADPLTRIALAAPTGKAAARMAEALRTRCVAENAPQPVLDAIDAARPVTVHRLLKVRPQGSPRYCFRADNPLAYDLVVVDETSMLSSSLMYRLLDAISPQTELLLVGDPDQLASVDAGSVLADIARAAARESSALAAVTDRLVTRHRFGTEIGALADAILAGDAAAVLTLLASRDAAASGNLFPAIDWIEPGSDGFRSLVATVVAQARRLGDLATAGDAAAAVAAQKDLQVLCAHRSGPLGAAGWNTLVEKRLGVFGGSAWYAGRPVMVTRNTPTLDLFNGDIGLVVPTPGETRGDAVESRSLRMEAAFPEGRSVRRVAVTRLDEVATVHALTIHKSQGSEYHHAIVVLPERASPILSRELFYTGVTRAIDRVTVVATRDIIAAAVGRPIRRASGLADRL
jgi:exodeoxyribonuclease V alpha subunit